MSDRADPLRVYHERQIADQATPVTLYGQGGPSGGPPEVVVGGSDGLYGARVVRSVLGGSVSASSGEVVLLDLPERSIVEFLTWTANRNGTLRLRLHAYLDGVATVIPDPVLDGSGGYAWTIAGMVTNHNPYFDVIEYDTAGNKFKLQLRQPLNFPQGFRITHENTDSFARNSRFDIAYRTF